MDKELVFIGWSYEELQSAMVFIFSVFFDKDWDKKNKGVNGWIVQTSVEDEELTYPYLNLYKQFIGDDKQEKKYNYQTFPVSIGPAACAEMVWNWLKQFELKGYGDGTTVRGFEIKAVECGDWQKFGAPAISVNYTNIYYGK